MKINFEKYSTPISVLLGALIIGGAVYWSGQNPQLANRNQGAQQPQEVQATPEKAAPVTAEDHVRGSRNAEVFVIEYADTECPFCKQFHSTMQQVMKDYGENGKVAWVYRHFPLDQLHQKARSEAVALECASEQGGDAAFWKYADRLYEVTPSNDGLEASELPKIATYVGLDASAFAKCQTSGRYDAHIEADAQNAIATGGQGTPWSIILTKDGKGQAISGAQPYDSLKKAIDSALKNN